MSKARKTDEEDKTLDWGDYSNGPSFSVESYPERGAPPDPYADFTPDEMATARRLAREGSTGDSEPLAGRSVLSGGTYEQGRNAATGALVSRPVASGGSPGRGSMVARQLQQMFTGGTPSQDASLDKGLAAALARTRARSDPLLTEELSPEMAALVANVGQSADEAASRMAMRRAPVSGTIAAGEPGGPPGPSMAQAGRVPVPVRQAQAAMTGAAPSELAQLRAALSRPSRLDQSLPAEDLGAAQRSDNVRGDLGRVSDALYGAFTRTRPQYADRGDNQAGQLLQRRAASDAERVRRTHADDSDPASASSKAYQDAIRATMPGLAAQLGPAIDRLSATLAKALMPTLQAHVEWQAKGAAAVEARKARLTEEAGKQKFASDEAAKRDAAALERAKLGHQPKSGAGAASDAKKTAASAKHEADLRKEFSALPAAKDFQAVSAGYAKILSAGPTAAGDMSLIYGYMKIVDPGSSVKEGEFSAAAESGGLGDKLKVAIGKARAGERLSPEMRADFIAEAKALYGSQKAQFDRIASQYREHAKRAGVNPAAVVQDLAVPDSGEAPGATAPARPYDDPAEEAAYQAYKKAAGK